MAENQNIDGGSPSKMSLGSEGIKPPSELTMTKTRPGRTVRNRARRDLIINDDALEQCKVYSSRVSTVFSTMKPGQVLGPAVGVLLDDDEDDRDDRDVNTTKRGKASSKQRLEEDAGQEVGRDTRRKVRSQKPAQAPDEILIAPDEILIDDNEIDSDQRRERSPTPPPVHDLQPIAYSRPRKTPRKVKKAIGELESLRERLHSKPRLRSSDVIELIDDEGLVTPSPKKNLTVKVRCRSGIQRFDILKTESFDQIFKQMAAHESTLVDRLIFFLGDRTVQPYDTPKSLQLSVADILDCHIKKQNTGQPAEKDMSDSLEGDEDILHLRVQANSAKSSAAISILKTEPLEKLMRQYAQRTGADFQHLMFTFDGDKVQRYSTPEDLGMEDDDCLDVVTL